MNPPISAEPNVASSEATIMGRMPNLLAEGCQVVPLMKFQSPISRRAGMPWINRKITMTDSAITAAAAQRKNTLSVMRSRTLNTFFLFPFSRWRLPPPVGPLLPLYSSPVIRWLHIQKEW